MNNIELKNNRQMRKITQTQLAEMCNVSLRTIQNWESGEVEIPKSKEKFLKKIFESVVTSNVISNTGAFSTNTINGDLGQQLSELISVQKGMQQDYLNLMQEKDRQIKELIEIIKQDKCNGKQ